jgi:hypothetical protein
MFSAILFMAVYLPPQTDAFTKTALSQLYKVISKQETAHPEVNLNQFFLISINMSNEQPEGKQS